MYRYGFVLIAIGIIVGLIIAAGFNFTDQLDAVNPAGTNSETEMTSEGDTEYGMSVLNQMSTAFANVAERVNPSVVTIFTETVVKGRSFPFHRPAAGCNACIFAP